MENQRFEHTPRPVLEKPSFREQLEHWVKLHPTIAKNAHVSLNETGRDLEQLDNTFADRELEAIVKDYNIPLNGLRFYRSIHSEQGDVFDLYKIPVGKRFVDAKRLPLGYAYKGGGARKLLALALGTDAREPRDIDLIRVDTPATIEQDQAVLNAVAPQEAAIGAHIEETTIEEYFATRDFTINEVLATDTDIIATKQCILDTIRHIIRITPFERYRFSNDGELGPKALARLLRFYAEHIHRYDQASFEDVADWEFEQRHISPFWLAVQLDDAFASSEAVAELYTQELIKRGQLPTHIQNAHQAATYLANYIQGPFYYRHALKSQFDEEHEWEIRFSQQERRNRPQSTH